jgi:UDP-GlcNAc:undecaprenyl-phosphate/decaprenyl-phosphate GlcNAc-1-phosphate transferase
MLTQDDGNRYTSPLRETYRTMDAVPTALYLAAALAISAGAVFVLARVAPVLGLIDQPGGRKLHQSAVPLVGGLGIFAAVLIAASLLGIAPKAGWFFLSLSIIIAVGCWDDLVDIRPRIKFAVQFAASAMMIWGAGVELTTVGDLIGWRTIGLSIFAVPLTIFAIVGVVNAVNMMDGQDGLAGSIAFVAFAWYAVMAAGSGLQTQAVIALVFCGAIAGFLLFNLRFPWQSRARVFLGDAGSLMIGFALGWFAIDLTQGPGRTLQPISALWVLLLPLADCVSLMIRRLRSGRSPFVADSQHIHHYFLRRGATHGQTLAILVSLSALFGLVGFVAWKLRIPEPILFWTFAVGFVGYHLWIQTAWKRLERRKASGETAPVQLSLLDEEEEIAQAS